MPLETHPCHIEISLQLATTIALKGIRATYTSFLGISKKNFSFSNLYLFKEEVGKSSMWHGIAKMVKNLLMGQSVASLPLVLSQCADHYL